MKIVEPNLNGSFYVTCGIVSFESKSSSLGIFFIYFILCMYPFSVTIVKPPAYHCKPIADIDHLCMCVRMWTVIVGTFKTLIFPSLFYSLCVCVCFTACSRMVQLDCPFALFQPVIVAVFLF